MRIILVNDYKYSIGGAEVYVFKLKKYLEHSGHQVLLYTSDTTPQEYYKEIQKISILKKISRIYNIYHHLKFYKVVKEFKPQIIHFHGIFNELSPSVIVASGSIPKVMTVHNSQIVSAVSIQSKRTGKNCTTDPCSGCTNCVGLFGSIYEKFKRSIHTSILRTVSLYITPSKYFADYIREAKYIRKLKVVNLGIEIKSYKEIFTFNNLLYVGRITEDKGILVLLKAFSTLLRTYPFIKLRIVGEGNDINTYKNYSKSHINPDNIEFLGKKSEKEIEILFRNSTVLVIPSIFPDNFPVVALEAVAYARPVIASNIGGIPEIIKNGINGLLVKPNDSLDLEKALKNLIKNKNLITKLSKNCKTEIKKFDIVDHVEEIIKIYQALI